MKKEKTKNNFLLKLLAVLFLLVFCSGFLVGCVGGNYSGSANGSGGGSSSGSQGGSTGGSSGESSGKPVNPYLGASENMVGSPNDIFMGAIGVYEIDSSKKVFYDNYTQKLVDFNFLIDRQFETLATVIYDGLNHVYGDNSFSGILSNYGENNISYNKESVIKENLYNANNTLKYPNSMNGGYELVMNKEPKLDGEGQPVTDGEGNQEYNITFEYNSTLITDRKWNKVLTSANDLIAPLKYIYLNTQTPNSIGNLNFNDETLKNYYKSFNGSLTNNENIKSIGFSEEYVWNVLYYISYSIIGEHNIQNSIDSAPYVFNGNQLLEINESNYKHFEKYKAYEKNLIDIVNNVFKMVKDGNNVKLSDNYCYECIDWQSTLYPMLIRYEYVYFDDINDICDAESDGAEDYGELFNPDTFVPEDNYEPNVDPDYDFEEDSLDSVVKLKAGSSRKLIEIILLPSINKLNYNKDEFESSTLEISFATKTDSNVLLNVLTSACGKESSSKVENIQAKFDEGSIGELVMPDGTIIKSPDRQESESSLISKDGYLIINSKVNDSTKEVETKNITVELFDGKDIKFSNVEFANILSLFSGDSYIVESTSEKIDIGRLNVCNNLFLANIKDQIYGLNIDKNFISLTFEYYDFNGNELSDIPELYLMSFSIYQ